MQQQMSCSVAKMNKSKNYYKIKTTWNLDRYTGYFSVLGSFLRVDIAKLASESS